MGILEDPFASRARDARSLALAQHHAVAGAQQRRGAPGTSPSVRRNSAKRRPAVTDPFVLKWQSS
jgi:hypothetical protein